MLLPNLTNFYKAIIKDRLLLLILALGLMLRSSNPTFGSPSLFVSNDEAIAHLSALNMLANKTPFSIANYTPFGAYAQIPFIIFTFVLMTIIGTVKSISDFELLLLTNEGYLLLIPRLISSLFGTLLIIPIYKITINLFQDKRIALISAFLTAVSFNLVHISNTGRPWSASLLLTMVSVLFIVKKKPNLSLLSMVLGFGFHQISAFIFPLLYLIQKISLSFIFKSLIAISMFLLLSSLSGTPNIITGIKNSQSFLLPGKILTDTIIGKPTTLSAQSTIVENLSLYFLSNLFFTDAVILIFGLIGFFFAFKHSPIHRALVIYSILFFLFASLFFHPLIRYLLPIIIILIPFAAFSIFKLIKNRKLILVVLAISSINSIYWISIYLKTPTFLLTKYWVEKNISSKQLIVYTGGRYNMFTPNKKSIEDMQLQDKDYAVRLHSRNITNSENTRSIIFTKKFPGETKYDQIKNAAPHKKDIYIIDYYYDPKDRLLNESPDQFTLVKQFNPRKDQAVSGIAEVLFDSSSNFESFEKRKSGSMFDLDRAGPIFEILKLRTD